MSITSKLTIVDNVPSDPWKFARDLEIEQVHYPEYNTVLRNAQRHNVLFNKGRYFETSIYHEETRQIK